MFWRALMITTALILRSVRDSGTGLGNGGCLDARQLRDFGSGAAIL